MEKFARRCDITSKGMNEGWYCECLSTYIKNEADAINFVNEHTYADLECAYNDDFIYYTEWDAEEDEDEWYDENGKIYENNQGITKKQIVIKQIEFQEQIHSMGFNIVECGNCGTVLIHKTKTYQIDCFCGLKMALSDCTDLYYSGIENNAEFN